MFKCSPTVRPLELCTRMTSQSSSASRGARSKRSECSSVFHRSSAVGFQNIPPTLSSSIFHHKKKLMRSLVAACYLLFGIRSTSSFAMGTLAPREESSERLGGWTSRVSRQKESRFRSIPKLDRTHDEVCGIDALYSHVSLFPVYSGTKIELAGTRVGSMNPY